MIKQLPAVVLASASPRRAELLRQLGVSFNVVAADIDETLMPHESPRQYVSRLAEEKASTVARGFREEAVVLGADTVVVNRGDILGKPRGSAHAKEMLRSLSGSNHEVLTGIALVRAASDLLCKTLVVTTEVRFRVVSEEEIARYVATGEPLDKAGAYGIQGLAGVFVESINGSYSNVVGLPLTETYQLLCTEGVTTGLS